MKNLLLITMLLLASIAYGQDHIYTTDGSRIEAKIIEVNPTGVKYKKQENLNGPDYVINRDKVLVVVYANGTYDAFTESRCEYLTGDSLQINFGKNFLAFNFLDIAFENLYFSYERIILNGKLGIRVPFLIGFSNSDDSPTNKILGTGLDIIIYPHGQGRIRYFFGPSFEYGKRRWGSYYDYYDSYGYYEYYIVEDRLDYYSVVLNNGVLFQPSRHWNMSLIFGLGLQEVEHRNGGAIPHVKFGTNIGYKF